MNLRLGELGGESIGYGLPVPCGYAVSIRGFQLGRGTMYGINRAGIVNTRVLTVSHVNTKLISIYMINHNHSASLC